VFALFFFDFTIALSFLCSCIVSLQLHGDVSSFLS